MDNVKKGQVLLVDDELEVLTPLRDFLTEIGYDVTAYASAKDAFEVLHKQEFDILLTDLIMPEMDGIELLKAALEIDPILVGIIITGKGTIQTAVEAMKIGAFDYLLKPVEWKMLIPVMARAIKVRLLHEAEKQYRSIIEDQTELICRFLPDMTLTFVNEPYCRYFNKKSEELIGKSFLPFIPEEDREFVRKQISSLNSSEPVQAEHRIIAPDGEIRWQQWTNRAIFDKHRNIIEYQSVGRDFTERKQVEEALLASEGKYRLLVNNANEIIVVAQDGMLKFVNPKTVELLAYSEKELLSRPFTDFIHPDDREFVFGNYTKRMRGERVPDIYSFRTIDKEGNTKWVEIRAVVFTWEGRPATLNFLSEITERKKAEDELKKSYEQLRSLTARLAELEEIEKQKLARELHDQIGQNLTALGINLNIIRSQTSEDSYDLIRSRVDDSMVLVEQTAERIRDVMYNLRPSVIDDYGLISALRWYGDQFSKRTGIHVTLHEEEALLRLPQHIETTLFRIAQEAFTNVAKHADASEITVTMKKTDNMIQLIIHDNGSGFKSSEMLKREQEPKWGIISMGERVQTVGGNLRVETSPGEGTTIIVEVSR